MENTENEIWKETYLSPDYLVSNYGRVKSKERKVPCKQGFRLKKEHILKQHEYHGYYHVGFIANGKHVNPLVHRLVMYAFGEIRPYPEWEIDHVNGNSLDNRFSNLEYVSNSENTKRAYDMGLQDKTKLSLANKNRKATPEQIAYIKAKFLEEGRTLGGRRNKDFYERMARQFGYTDPQSIYHILLGRTNRFFGEDIVQTTNSNASSENCSGKG